MNYQAQRAQRALLVATSTQQLAVSGSSRSTLKAILSVAVFASLTLAHADQAPSIVTQPASQTRIQGSNATFSVAGQGNKLVYQWRFNASSLTGATNTQLTL